MLNKDYREMLQLLLEERAEFLVVGAYAMAAHGVPRATGDIDLWVRPNRENAHRVYRALARFGAPLEGTDPMEFAIPNLVFQIGIAPRRIDILTSIDGVAFMDAISDPLLVSIEDLVIPVLSRAALIANKRASGRPKDLLDLATLEASHPDSTVQDSRS
jgi:hypothetical protein